MRNHFSQPLEKSVVLYKKQNVKIFCKTLWDDSEKFLAGKTGNIVYRLFEHLGNRKSTQEACMLSDFPAVPAGAQHAGFLRVLLRFHLHPFFLYRCSAIWTSWYSPMAMAHRIRMEVISISSWKTWLA